MRRAAGLVGVHDGFTLLEVVAVVLILGLMFLVMGNL